MSEFSSSSWNNLVAQDLRDLEINLSEAYIQLMSKFEFRKLLRRKIKIKKHEFLKSLQDKHSKTKRLEIEDSPQEYLRSTYLSTSQKRFLFSLWCKMTINKTHFKQKFANLVCRLCLDANSEESLSHLCDCSFIKQHVPEISTVSVDDIFGGIEDQIKAVNIFMKVFTYIEETEQGQAHTKCASCTV